MLSITSLALNQICFSGRLCKWQFVLVGQNVTHKPKRRKIIHLVNECVELPHRPDKLKQRGYCSRCDSLSLPIPRLIRKLPYNMSYRVRHTETQAAVHEK